MKDRVKKFIMEQKLENQKKIIDNLYSEFSDKASKQLIEAMIWDWLATQKGYKMIEEDIKNGLEG